MEDIKTINKELNKLEKFAKPTTDKINALRQKIRDIEEVEKDAERKALIGKCFAIKRKVYQEFFKLLSYDTYDEFTALHIEFEKDSIIIKNEYNIDYYYDIKKAKQITKKEFNEALRKAKKMLK